MEVSARLINTLYAFVHSASGHPSAETVFLRLADTDELLLLSHSLGGSVAFSVLTGQCSEVICSVPSPWPTVLAGIHPGWHQIQHLS